MSADPLRSTLDHLALDPDAGNDRRYLVTVLRRLGYSDQEIRRVLGDEGDPGEEGRVIEVEYTGKGNTFLFGKVGTEAQMAEAIAQGDGALTFTMAGDDGEVQQFHLAGDEEAGVESFEAVDLDDVDVSDDWGDDWGDDDFSVESDDADGTDDTDFEDGEEVVEFRETKPVTFNEKRMQLAPGPGWEEVDAPEDDAAWEPVDQDIEWLDDEHAEGELIEVLEEPYRYEDYTLYTRPVELTTGKTQHIYFFSKDEPRNGTPCDIPPGYEVDVSEKTGLPFLRKSEGAKRQCGALTEDDDQCRLTARAGSDFCHVHKNYVPPTEEELRARLDTAPAHDVFDSMPGEDAEGKHQCAAITHAGAQCRNTAREDSPYCGSHRDYRPHSASWDTDTVPVGHDVEDTLPVVAKEAPPETVVEPLDSDYQLYRRPVTTEEGARKHLYFFAKDEPADGDPAPVPEGYEVAVDEQTEKPFLRKISARNDGPPGNGDPASKAPRQAGSGPDETTFGVQPEAPRVRVKRVTADDPEAAKRQVQGEGGNVRGVVPIRIEERDE